jgi:prophage maintenance system killer protein
MKRFDEFHISEIIEYNKIECARRNELFNVKSQLLLEIIDKVNQLSDISDDRERILKQASTLMGLIVFEQPFNNANKSTATAVTIDFLHSNGFDLDIKDIRKQSELLDILEKIMYLFEDESQKGVLMIREFLEKHMKELH